MNIHFKNSSSFETHTHTHSLSLSLSPSLSLLPHIYTHTHTHTYVHTYTHIQTLLFHVFCLRFILLQRISLYDSFVTSTGWLSFFSLSLSLSISNSLPPSLSLSIYLSIFLPSTEVSIFTRHNLLYVFIFVSSHKQSHSIHTSYSMK